MPIHSRLFEKARASDLTSNLRDGSRAEVAAAVILLVAATGACLGPAVFGVGGPRAAAEAYLAAETRADADAVSQAITIRSDLAGAADATLLDQRALKAAIANQGRFQPPVDVSEPIVAGNVASVTASFRTETATRRTKLNLERYFPPLRLQGVWKVRIDPSYLVVQVPAAAGSLTVDGIPVRLPKSTVARVAVFPGEHNISTTGGQFFAGQPIKLAGTNSSSPPAIVPLKLTPTGTSAAVKTVAAALAACSSQTAQIVQGCPQTLDEPGAPAVSWALIGDPTEGIAVNIDGASAAVQALGHFRMIATSESSGRVTHRPSSGGYSVQLRPSGTGFEAGPVTVTTAAPLATRPAAANDQAILEAVRGGLVRCAQATVSAPPDCPQIIFASASNVSWSIQGDPIAGSAVAFQPPADSFVVAGRVTMHYRYDSSLLGIALHNDNSAEYPFTAHLFWDGQQPILITIDGPTRG